ncbi:MAG: effector protein PipB, partial [Acidobacteriota bacterium]
MPDPVALGAKWIPDLWQKLRKLSEGRRARLRVIEDAIGVGRLELLAQHYIEPDCQRTNPADHREDEPMHVLRQPVRDYFNRFFNKPFFEKDGRHVVFVLSDAGMGKTSLLLMFKLTDELSFWPNNTDFQLLKLGPDTLDAMEAIERPER